MKTVSIQYIFKFSRIEIVFFLTFFILFPILSTIEHDLYEAFSFNLTMASIVEDIVKGILHIVPFLLYYKIVIPYLYQKRYGLFSLLVLLFLIFLNLFKVYIEYGLVSKLWFLPDQMVSNAARWFKSEVTLFHFSVTYILRDLLVVSALGYFMNSNKQEKQLTEVKQRKIESELKYLKVQLQPHFFFNTLNNIYSLAMQKSDKTAPLVARHAEMMRYILYHSQQTSVELTKEIDFLKNYVSAELLHYSAESNIEFDTQGINNSVVIEPLLLLPFIENAFKHGLQENADKGFVNIVTCLIENELTVQVRNSKPTAKTQHPKGVGLDNATGRLNLLYPDHRLNIHETEREYEVALTLTLASHD